jgi:hypothetical protein
MGKFLLNCVSSDGKVSSKRLVTLLAFLMMTIGFISNLFWKYTVDVTIYDSMKWIVIGGLGFTASEQFANKNGDKINQQVNGSNTDQQ